MPTNRRTIERRRKVPKFTDEVLDLFERGMQLVVEGYDDIDAPDDEKHDEFRQISKRLDWTLLGRAPHETSIFEDFADLEPPEYMKARERVRPIPISTAIDPGDCCSNVCSPR